MRALPDGFKIRTDLYQVMPPLGAEDMAKLRDSIAKEGVQIPVIVREEDGGIIDGHHRWQIASELSMTGDVVLDIRSYATDALARAAAYEINDARRHMSITDRRELARRLRASGATQAETAAALGVSRETIRNEESSALAGGAKAEDIEATLGKRESKPGARRTKSAEESAALTARIVELDSAGWTQAKIADHLGLAPSRVSVRLKEHREPKPVEPAKWERARDLAGQGNTSEEIASVVGVGRQAVKNWAKRYEFEIPADVAVANTQRRINSGDVLANSVEIFAHTAEGLGLINFDQIEGTTDEQAAEWLCSLKETQTAIRTLIRQIKSLTKEQSHE